MIKRKIFKSIAMTLIAAFILNNSIAFAAENNSVKYRRIQGKNRYRTSEKVAKEIGDHFSNIVVASGEDFADALSGSVLASKLGAPLVVLPKKCDGSMYSPVTRVWNMTEYEGSNIYILGGTGAIDSGTESEIKRSGRDKVSRIGGANRYESNLLVNKKLNTPKGSPIFIVSGLGFADAVSVSGVAGSKEIPIYLVGNDISNEALNQIKEIQPSKIYIAGGEGAVNKNIENTLKKVTTNIVRFSGTDRYDTSLKISEYFIEDTDKVVIASGSNFADSLSGGVLAASYNSPILLVPTTGNVSRQKGFIDKHSIKNLDVIGGAAAVSDRVVLDLIGVKSDITDVNKTNLNEKQMEKIIVDEFGAVLDEENSGYGLKIYETEFGYYAISDNMFGIGIYSQLGYADTMEVRKVLSYIFAKSTPQIINDISGDSDGYRKIIEGKEVELWSDNYYLSPFIDLTIWFK